MFILDTNVISTLMSSRPAPEVAAWVAAQPEARLFTTAICQAEILAGIEIMPDGHRRRGLLAAAKAIFATAFDGRILPFNETAAEYYADLFALRRRTGQPAATADLMIAAIARSQGASMVTRDKYGFAGCGIEVIDPWEPR